MKDSFVLYTEYMAQIELLNMEQRGELLTSIMNHALGRASPELDAVTSMAFSFIRSRMDRDGERYEKTVEARKEAGKMGGRPKANGFLKSKRKQKNLYMILIMIVIVILIMIKTICRRPQVGAALHTSMLRSLII